MLFLQEEVLFSPTEWWTVPLKGPQR